MAEGTLPVWVILSIIGGVIIIAVPSFNYYVPNMGKLRAQCLKDKSSKQRNNNIIRLKRRVDEYYYAWIVIIIYMVVSMSFCVENNKIILDSEHLFLRVLLGLGLWIVVGFILVVFLTALMSMCQEIAIKDLKDYYGARYKVAVLYLDKIDFDAYYEYESPEP